MGTNACGSRIYRCGDLRLSEPHVWNFVTLSPMNRKIPSPTIAGILLSLSCAGCVVSNRSNYSSRYQNDFAPYTTFTCVPYSILTGDTALAGRNENAMLFALANDIMGRGYEYTPFLDSADFIATVHVTDSFDPGGNLVAPTPPAFQDSVPFRMNAASFDTSAAQPVASAIDSSARVRPEVNCIIYYPGAHHIVLKNWIGGTVAKTSNLGVAAQYVIERLVGLTPFCANWKSSDWYGPGVSGFGFALHTQGGTDFWPEVTFLSEGFPAAAAGLREGDVILEINGHSLRNLNYVDCLRLFRGDPGRQIVLNVWRYPSTTFGVTYMMAIRPPVK